MQAVLSALRPCFGALSQLQRLDPAGNTGLVTAPVVPEDLQRRLCQYIDDMRVRLADAGLPPQDVQDITYAIVALADELALSAGEPLASFWMAKLLQFHYFRENTAGDGFFLRLAEIRRDSRRTQVLRAYALCLLFGFQGKYRLRGGELELLTLSDQVQREAFGAGGAAADLETLSPHGQRPTELLAKNRRRAPALIAAAGAVIAAVLLYGVQRIVLSRNLGALQTDLSAVSHP